MGETLTSATPLSQQADNPSIAEQAAQMEKEGSLPSNADPNGEDRPEWLPPKFKSPEELAKSYAELEKKLGKGKAAQEEADDEEDDGPEIDPDAPSAEETARKITKDAGLDFDEMASRYWDEGGLRDTDYKALEKKGIPRHMVDQFIAGQQAIVEARQNQVYESVGGKENYSAMTEWAGENLSEAEVRAYNKAVASNDFDTVQMAVAGLRARYEAKVGFEPKKSVKGATSSKSTSGVYRSWAEAEADMNDPRYERDPAFRRDVEQKIGRSPNL